MFLKCFCLTPRCGGHFPKFSTNNYRVFCFKRLVYPCSLTWNLKINPWKRRILLETIIFRFHVKLWGCMALNVSPSVVAPFFFIPPIGIRAISNVSTLSFWGRRKERHGVACNHMGKPPRNLRCFGILRNTPLNADLPQQKVEPYETLVEHSQSGETQHGDGLVVFGKCWVVRSSFLWLVFLDGGLIHFLFFNPTWGSDPIWRFFFDGLKPPASFACVVALNLIYLFECEVGW